MLAATLAERLGLEARVDDCVRLGVRGPASRAGRKVMTLIYAVVLGADGIDHCDVLRAGRTGRLLGGWMPAPSTLGTFLRGVYVRACPPARPSACRVPDARVERRGGTGRRAPDR